MSLYVTLQVRRVGVCAAPRRSLERGTYTLDHPEGRGGGGPRWPLVLLVQGRFLI